MRMKRKKWKETYSAIHSESEIINNGRINNNSESVSHQSRGVGLHSWECKWIQSIAF